MINVPYPAGEFFCILLPKDEKDINKNVNISGYRMIKEIGWEEILERKFQIQNKLEGVKGIPKYHGVVYVKKPCDGVMLRCTLEEYIEGVPLNHLIDEKRNTQTHDELIKTVVGYILKTIDVIIQIHERGVVHNDISPNNILVTKDDRVYLIDYALSSAKYFNPLGFSSRRFSSPELFKRVDTITPASDIWSVGVMLYCLIKDKHPINDNPVEVTEVLSDEKRYEEAKQNINFDHIPEGIKRIIGRNMSYDPKQRYQTATEFASELRKAI
jgi:serine/threonine protein kinase